MHSLHTQHVRVVVQALGAQYCKIMYTTLTISTLASPTVQVPPTLGNRERQPASKGLMDTHADVSTAYKVKQQPVCVCWV